MSPWIPEFPPFEPTTVTSAPCEGCDAAEADPLGLRHCKEHGTMRVTDLVVRTIPSLEHGYKAVAIDGNTIVETAKGLTRATAAENLRELLMRKERERCPEPP